jgi:hypothetical protein
MWTAIIVNIFANFYGTHCPVYKAKWNFHDEDTSLADECELVQTGTECKNEYTAYVCSLVVVGCVTLTLMFAITKYMEVEGYGEKISIVMMFAIPLVVEGSMIFLLFYSSSQFVLVNSLVTNCFMFLMPHGLLFRATGEEEKYLQLYEKEEREKEEERLRKKGLLVVQADA